MDTMEGKLSLWEKEIYHKSFAMIQRALDDVKKERDVVKQKHCADYFDISVTTLKMWVAHGCPEIRLKTGTPLYSKTSIESWLLSQQK
ncbi:DNA-binding protein [Enterococcus sp. E5-162]|uniref:DNA-binding protein n=1 Tax=Enterococcus sp. E5-162 TaxID=3002979 RepID=UPI003FA34366